MQGYTLIKREHENKIKIKQFLSSLTFRNIADKGRQGDGGGDAALPTPPSPFPAQSVTSRGITIPEPTAVEATRKAAPPHSLYTLHHHHPAAAPHPSNPPQPTSPLHHAASTAHRETEHTSQLSTSPFCSPCSSQYNEGGKNGRGSYQARQPKTHIISTVGEFYGLFRGRETMRGKIPSLLFDFVLFCIYGEGE